jgi:hypothetical protein
MAEEPPSPQTRVLCWLANCERPRQSATRATRQWGALSWSVLRRYRTLLAGIERPTARPVTHRAVDTQGMMEIWRHASWRTATSPSMSGDIVRCAMPGYSVMVILPSHVLQTGATLKVAHDPTKRAATANFIISGCVPMAILSENPPTRIRHAPLLAALSRQRVMATASSTRLATTSMATRLLESQVSGPRAKVRLTGMVTTWFGRQIIPTRTVAGPYRSIALS